MKMATGITAFKASLYDVGLSLSPFSESSIIFHNREELFCANEVSASKQASKQATF